MNSLSLAPPFCVADGPGANCGEDFWVIAIYWVAFFILTSIVLISLLTAAIIDAFADAEVRVLKRDLSVRRPLTSRPTHLATGARHACDRQQRRVPPHAPHRPALRPRVERGRRPPWEVDARRRGRARGRGALPEGGGTYERCGAAPACTRAPRVSGRRRPA